MLEIIKVLVETASQAIPTIAAARRKKKLRGIGAELFLLYVQLNEMLLCADEIINSLEDYVKLMGRHIRSGVDTYTWDDVHALNTGLWIAERVQQQRWNLTKITNILAHWGLQLEIMDAESYRKLHNLIVGKISYLGVVLGYIRRGRFPVAPAEERIRAAILSSSFGLDREELEEFYESIVAGSVSTDVAWDQEVYPAIAEYLEVYKPRVQLKLIRELLAEMRATLEHYFSIEDVLLDVGDKRFLPKYEDNAIRDRLPPAAPYAPWLYGDE